MLKSVRKYIRALLRVLFILIALLLLLPLLLYIPAVQSYVCQKVVSTLNNNELGLSYSVGEVRINFPLEVNVRQVSACRADGDTILYVGRLHTGLNNIPFFQDYFVVNRLGIEEVQLNMTSDSTLSMSGKVESLDVLSISLDPASHRLYVGQVNLDNFSLMMQMLPSDDEEEDDDEESPGWDIQVGTLKMAQGEYLLDRPASAFFLHTSFDALQVGLVSVLTAPIDVQVGLVKMEQGCCRLDLDSTAYIPYYDYNHMDLRDINMSAEAVHYESDHIAATLHALSAAEARCGMEVQELSTEFRMDSSMISAQRFRLVMPGTNLSGNVLLDYNFFTAPHPGLFDVQLNGRVSATDVVRYTAPYVPDVATYWPEKASVQLNVNAYATADTLRLTQCDVELKECLTLSAQASGEQVFAGSKGRAELRLNASLMHADSLLSAFVASPEHRSYVLPDSLTVDASGGWRSGVYYADAYVEQDAHKMLTAEATYHTSSDRYSGSILAREVSLRDFLPALTVSRIDANVDVQGRHVDPRTQGAEMTVTVQLDTLATAQSGHLVGTHLSGQLADGRYTLALDCADEHVGLMAEAHGLLTADTLTSVGTMDMQRLQADIFAALEDTTGTFGAHTRWELQSDWELCHTLQIYADSLCYAREQQHWSFNDIQLSFHSLPHYMSAIVKGGDCNATLQTECGVDEVSGVIDSLVAEVNRQVENVSLDAEHLVSLIPHTDLRLSMSQENPFYPFVSYFNYGFSHLGVNFHSDQQLNLEALVLDYDDMTQHYDTLRALLSPLVPSTEATADYAYELNVAHSSPKLRKAYNVQMDGEVHLDSLTLHMIMVDGLKTRLYDMGASLGVADDTLSLHFMERPIIYAQQLTVNADNFVRVTQFKNPTLQQLGVEADMRMDGPQGFSLQLLTHPDTIRHGNLLTYNVHHLDLDYLGRAVQWANKTEGIAHLDGTFFVRPDSVTGAFDLCVDGFRLNQYRADSVACGGRASLQNGLLDVALGMSINARDVLTATLRSQTDADGQKLPMEALLLTDSLPLELANVYMPENVPLSGLLNARVEVGGPEAGKERAQGYLLLTDASVRYADANATLHFPADSIRIVDSHLLFNHYALTAVGKNPLYVDGVVDLSEDLASPRMDLTVRGDNVTLFRSSRCTDKQQYICGTLPANVNLKLKGVSPALMLTGQVSALSGSDLQYYLQEDPLESDSKLNGLVEFVEFSKLNQRSTSLLFGKSESVGGFGVNIRIDVARNAALDIHLSTTSDDKIAVRGGGSLQFSMSDEGTMRLNGTYDVSSGDVAFKLPMLPVSKSFDIEDGSLLRWNGEVENPELNITASEEVRCTINDETGVSRIVKFVVYVYIRGTMDNLELSFSCGAPEDASIQNQINSLTEEERSKQAIRLLVTQSYSGPGVSTSSSVASANGAINALLQQEVESFFNQHMKNTQISVGIDTYDADGTGTARTDYSVKISQRLFNDRMRIVLGGRVTSSEEESGSNREEAVINDFSLEWLLREDGSRYVRLFRKTNYESILEGEIVETGLGYVVQRSSYRLLDLLIPSGEKRRQRILERIQLLDDHTTLPSVDSLLHVAPADSLSPVK